jgi:hypothetical protein
MADEEIRRELIAGGVPASPRDVKNGLNELVDFSLLN